MRGAEGAEPESRALRAGGRRLAGGAAIVIGALLFWVSPFAPRLLGLPVAAVLGTALLAVGAGLLASAIVDARAPLSWAKVGGIALIGYCCCWLALFVVPGSLWIAGGVAVGTGFDATRVLVGLIAGNAIARAWPVRGYARWAMLFVVACDALGSFVWGWMLLAVPSPALMAAVGALLPLALVALGASHVLGALAARRHQARSAADAGGAQENAASMRSSVSRQPSS